AVVEHERHVRAQTTGALVAVGKGLQIGQVDPQEEGSLNRIADNAHLVNDGVQRLRQERGNAFPIDVNRQANAMMKVMQTESEPRVDLGFHWEGFCWDTAWTMGTLTHLACQPGQDMPDGLGDRIVADLRRVMPDHGVAQYFASQPGIFKSYDHLAITIDRQNGDVVGLIGSKWLKF